MADFINISTDAFEDIAAQFGAAAESIPALAARATHNVAKKAVEFLSTYPPKFSGRIEFVSDRQRRWFFAALRAGQIQVPYQRTGILGRGWRTTVGSSGENGYTSLNVTNNTEYTPFVQVQASQASIHRGRWRTVEDAAEELEGWASEAADVLGDEILSALQGQSYR